ncbi:MAG: hypothetical protein EWV52_16295 [Microcystis panniformis Mp_MB_F_20051200_S6D]|nr:MAG: hypothetical protein EWV87_21470 [Microcystis panniformis Mp_GB_SS_20050300_S99]TRV44258.1 MAG: hypothetical protein EWV42_21995 [Microcystis panniformis Mp_GB_SS_20050300_S99D]TRV49022.1 MAG: hypothetical protein EWV43_09405 [Microcystis panniformis Mp_MB_F_20080800_S26D]TRV61890.1 MAG: hypothetical protein EWV69_06890 [Microcystis panniformis Mp_MB_F_20080800_S26]TRV65013.1 MAG: hypothetical protein EWV86_09815 [Microcystis panniformis Mp_MB_F_20051200_S9D]TRV70423.1 MAG: hypothetica
MVFCSQVLTELDKFLFFSSFTHYLFLVDSQTDAATDLSSEIQKFVEGHRWYFVFAAIIIGVAVETRISYFSAFRIRHLFPNLKKDFLNTFVRLLTVKIVISILLYLFIQFIFSLLSSIEDNVYVGLIIALVFGFIISSLNPNLEQIDQVMGGFSLSTITDVSSLIKKLLELYQGFQISIMETFDEKLASERNRLYDDTRHEFDLFQRLTIQKYIEELIGRYTLERTQKNYQRRLDTILGRFSGSDQKEELIWLLFTMGVRIQVRGLTKTEKSVD